MLSLRRCFPPIIKFLHLSIKKQQTQQQNEPFRLSLWNISQPSNISCDLCEFTPIFNRLLVTSELYSPSFAHCPSCTQSYTPLLPCKTAVMFSCWLIVSSSSLLPKLLLSLQWSTTPAGLMILQIILKCTFDWYSSPGYANSCVQAALSLFTTLPSVIQPANFISTDPILVSIYLMKRFNGIWPHLNP